MPILKHLFHPVFKLSLIQMKKQLQELLLAFVFHSGVFLCTVPASQVFPPDATSSKLLDRITSALPSHVPFALQRSVSISLSIRATKYTYIRSISQIPNQRRERNDVCEGNASSPSIPSKVLVTIGPHG